MALMGAVPLGTIDRGGGSPSVLAFHGFGATPQEVLLVADLATELGLRVRAPLLPGHGSSVEDLARTRWSDWRGAAQRAFDELAQAGKVIVVGSSMGSLLALDLAASCPDRTLGVAALAPPTRLGWPFPSLALGVVSALNLPDFSIRKRRVDIRDVRQRETQATYDRQPAHAGNDVRVAGRRVEARLRDVRCPALVMHARRDHVCPVDNARRVYARLGTPSRDKELVILPRSFHIITRDVERGLVRAHLEGFLRRLARGERRSAAQRVPVEPYPPAPRSVAERL